MSLVSLLWFFFSMIAPAKAEDTAIVWVYEQVREEQMGAEARLRQILEKELLKSRDKCLAYKDAYATTLRDWAITEDLILALGPEQSDFLATLRERRNYHAVRVREIEAQAAAAGADRLRWSAALDQLGLERDQHPSNGVTLQVSRLPGDPLPTIHHDPRKIGINVGFELDDNLPRAAFGNCFATLFKETA